jgi:hypothetical protein
VGVFNGHLALADGVPKLDGAITRARDNLTIVWGKSNRQCILLVSCKLTSSLACLQVPKTKSAVPRR